MIIVVIEFIDYANFVVETQSGEHGKTAKFYMEYVRLIDLYHLFSRSIRTNDIPLFVYCLPDIATLFFTFNHPNYARWILRYHSNLTNMETTHPGLRDYFDKGVFTIRRTKKNFSRGPIDLNLEQTINADSANKLSGIVHVTNSISARQRWAKSRFIVSSIISHLLDSIGIKNVDDTCAELKNHRIKRDNKQLKLLLTEFGNFVNPFTVEDKNRLFNVCTGKACSIAAENFLLNYRTIGEGARDTFSKECKNDANRFESPIKRIQTATFANDGVKRKYTAADGKIKEMTLERDHFAKLFCLALQNKLDVSAILSYPLTPLPLALCHIDGTMNKTTKSVLVDILEQVVDHKQPVAVDAVIFDGFLILRSLVVVPKTFGQISNLLLQKITAHEGTNIHLVFDQYFKPSIKDSERERRGALHDQGMPYLICGPEQRRPTNYDKAFNNEHFKIALVKFLFSDWSRNDYASIIGRKRIYMNVENECFLFYCDEENVRREEIKELWCSHEEADTRMIFHSQYIARNTMNANIVIRSTDTDVLIILLGNLHYIADTNVWMEIGHSSKNTLRFLDCTQMWEVLGQEYCRALLAFHVFTGCDYCASFFGIGKKKAYKYFLKNKTLQTVFANFGEYSHISSDDLKEIEKFVSSMYGQMTTNVNDARTNIFNKTYNTSKDLSKDILKVKKSLDSRRMPPCERVITQKVKRLKYICNIWSNATSAQPSNLDPTNFGWLLSDDKLVPLWFDGDAVPNSISEIIVDPDIENNSENDSDDSNDSEFEDSSSCEEESDSD